MSSLPQVSFFFLKFFLKFFRDATSFPLCLLGRALDSCFTGPHYAYSCSAFKFHASNTPLSILHSNQRTSIRNLRILLYHAHSLFNTHIMPFHCSQNFHAYIYQLSRGLQIYIAVFCCHVMLWTNVRISCCYCLCLPYCCVHNSITRFNVKLSVHRTISSFVRTVSKVLWRTFQKGSSEQRLSIGHKHVAAEHAKTRQHLRVCQ